MSDFLIVGGGVLGLLTARELLAGGAGVTLVEQDRCGQQASWAGGGIVSPLYPWRYSEAVTALASWAQGYYPGLAASLLEECGIDSELQECGLLMLQAEEEDQALAWARQSGRPMKPVDSAFIYDRAGMLADGFDRALWMPTVANVRNPRLVQALVTGLARHPGMRLLENTRVTKLETSGDRITEALIHGRQGTERLTAERFIITAGAWSSAAVSALGIDLPVRPVRGQMLLYRPAGQLLDCIVLYRGRYLIPRRDGHILVGSTLEESGFDDSVTPQARESLRRSAVSMLPCLADHPVKRQWAGLRPGAPRGIPYIGQLGGYGNLYINAGHYRNGLVLAPASARLLADIVLGRPPIVDPSPYAPANRLKPGF